MRFIGIALKNRITSQLSASASLAECATLAAKNNYQIFNFDGSICQVNTKIFDEESDDSTGFTTYLIDGWDENALQSYENQWESTCFALSNKLSVITRDNSFDTFLPSHLFYYCWHYLEKNFPFLVALQEEAYGGMKLMHDNDYHSFVKSVAAVKAESTWNSDMFSHDIEINRNWCKNHIRSN